MMINIAAEKKFLDHVSAGRFTVSRTGVIMDTKSGRPMPVKYNQATNSLCFPVKIGSDYRSMHVARLVYQVYVKKLNKNQDIIYKSGDSYDVSVDNLDVTDKRVSYNTFNAITKPKNRRFSADTVLTLRHEYAKAGGVISCEELSKKHDCTFDYMSRLLRGNMYKAAGGPMETCRHLLTVHRRKKVAA